MGSRIAASIHLECAVMLRMGGSTQLKQSNVVIAACLTAVLMVLGACSSVPIEGKPPTILDPVELKLWQLQGNASLQQGTDIKPVSEGAIIQTGQPIQVRESSSARLRLGGDALFELGPGARLIALSLPGHGNSGLSTGLRLERGYMRVVLAKDDRVTQLPAEISLGRWVAQIQSGEYFFDARDDRVGVCLSVGSLRLGGPTRTTATMAAGHCFDLVPGRPPEKLAMTESGWAMLRSEQDLALAIQHSLHERAEARVAVLERESVDGIKTPNKPEAQAPDLEIAAVTADVIESAASSAISANTFHLELPDARVPMPDVRPQPVVVITSAPTSSSESIETSAPEIARMPDLGAGQQIDARVIEAAQRDVSAPPIVRASSEITMLEPPAPRDWTTDTGLEDSTGTSMRQMPDRMLPGEWIVNVSSHSSHDAANERVDNLESFGFIATVRSEIVRGLNSYRVVIQGIESEEIANSVVSDLQTKHGLGSAWAYRVR